MPLTFDIDRYFTGSLERLRAEAEYFSTLTNHRGEIGRLNESHLVALLRSYLPPKFGIGTGFIVSGNPGARISPQCDIIIYDALSNAPLYTSEAWSIFPIEMVYGVIEVKTKLTSSELKDAFDKCKKIRLLAEEVILKPAKSPVPKEKIMEEHPDRYVLGHKCYLKQVSSAKVSRHALYYDKLPPRFYIFGYSGWETERALLNNFKRVTLSVPDAHIHGLCNLNKKDSLFVNHLPFKLPAHRCSVVRNKGFRTFLMNLPSQLASVTPQWRENGFDMVYLEQYGLPKVS